MKLRKVSCEIIKDMLPLYYDSVCSDDSKRMVEEHLSECNNCKVEFKKIEHLNLQASPPI